jgi:hypothetical protein
MSTTFYRESWGVLLCSFCTSFGLMNKLKNLQKYGVWRKSNSCNRNMCSYWYSYKSGHCVDHAHPSLRNRFCAIKSKHLIRKGKMRQVNGNLEGVQILIMFIQMENMGVLKPQAWDTLHWRWTWVCNMRTGITI